MRCGRRPWVGRLSWLVSIWRQPSAMRNLTIKQFQGLGLGSGRLLYHLQPGTRGGHSQSGVEGLNFSDHKTVFQFKKTRELLRSLLILRSVSRSNIWSLYYLQECASIPVWWTTLFLSWDSERNGWDRESSQPWPGPPSTPSLWEETLSRNWQRHPAR